MRTCNLQISIGRILIYSGTKISRSVLFIFLNFVFEFEELHFLSEFQKCIFRIF